METLQTVVSNLKAESAKKFEIKFIEKDYGLKSCSKFNFNTFNSNKLEIIFLSNIEYLCLNEQQLQKVLNRRYKNLLKRKTCSTDLNEIELEAPIIVNNVTNITNNITNTIEDYWDQTDY